MGIIKSLCILIWSFHNGSLHDLCNVNWSLFKMLPDTIPYSSYALKVINALTEHPIMKSAVQTFNSYHLISHIFHHFQWMQNRTWIIDRKISFLRRLLPPVKVHQWKYTNQNSIKYTRHNRWLMPEISCHWH